MTTIITSDDQLRSLIPNVIVSVKGETPLYNKLLPFLESAELWVKTTFTGEETFTAISELDASNPTNACTARLVVAEAFRNAIPSLDLVLTPNGFGVVSNNNVAPASKQRVDRLIGEMTVLRDNEIELLLKLLPAIELWKDSEQFKWFAATLFPGIDVANACGERTYRWDKFLELRLKIIDVETSLAEDFFSPELMTALRQRVLSQNLQSRDTAIVTRLRSQIIAVLKGEDINMRQMIDIVNIIRKSASLYPEWHNSDTAKLFSPPIFQNSKQSHGYFF